MSLIIKNTSTTRRVFYFDQTSTPVFLNPGESYNVSPENEETVLEALKTPTFELLLDGGFISLSEGTTNLASVETKKAPPELTEKIPITGLSGGVELTTPLTETTW